MTKTVNLSRVLREKKQQGFTCHSKQQWTGEPGREDQNSEMHSLGKQVLQLLQYDEDADIRLLETAGLGNALPQEEITRKRLRKKAYVHPFEQLSRDRIYCLDDIREVCLDYGLRFLPSTQYKGALAPIVRNELKILREQIGQRAFEKGRFYIAGPEEAFILREIEQDPLLFMQVGENAYYQVGQ